MWLLAATTGMRRSELLVVRRDSLNLEAETLAIGETAARIGGRTGPD